MKISTLLAFVAGVGIGVLGSATYFDRKYSKILDEESAAFREYRLKIDQENYGEGPEGETPNYDDDISDVVGSEPVRFIRPKKPSERIIKQYNKYSKKPDLEVESSPLEDDYHEEEEEIESPVELPTDGEPYVISIEEFTEEFDEFDKITLYYYELDDTLTDESEEVIPNVEELIGIDALSEFGGESGSHDIVYVRNPQYGADYEVIRLTKSYQETVLGIFDLKEKRRKYNGEN